MIILSKFVCCTMINSFSFTCFHSLYFSPNFNVSFWTISSWAYLFTCHILKWYVIYINLLFLESYFIFSLFKNCFCSFYRPKDLKFPRGLMIPKRGLVYDHVYIRKQYGSWNSWTSLLSPVDIDEKTKVSRSRSWEWSSSNKGQLFRKRSKVGFLVCCDENYLI